MNVRYHSSQKTTDLFIAENVSKITEIISKLFQVAYTINSIKTKVGNYNDTPKRVKNNTIFIYEHIN